MATGYLAADREELVGKLWSRCLHVVDNTMPWYAVQEVRETWHVVFHGTQASRHPDTCPPTRTAAPGTTAARPLPAVSTQSAAAPPYAVRRAMQRGAGLQQCNVHGECCHETRLFNTATLQP